MKALLFSCKNFNSKIKELATRPLQVRPELVKYKEYSSEKSIVVFITVEEGDNIEKALVGLSKEIRKFSDDTRIKKIVICPFAHLSSRLSSSELAIKFLDFLEENLQEDMEVLRVHFGSHKSLLLDVHGHKGNVRFREF